MNQHDQSVERAHRQVGRRAVTRGAAWTVPVVAVAVGAPAMATSGCHKVSCKLDWDVFTDGRHTGEALVTTGGTGTTVMVTTSGDTAHANNGYVTSTSTGGQSKVMRFYDQNGTNNTVQTVTITFSKLVSNVSFSVLDVDSSIDSRREYEDVVTILTSGWSGTTHSNVKGNGTSGSPYRAVNTDSPVAGSSSASNVDLSWAGPLTSIVFTYAQDGTVCGDPYIGISDICFEVCS